MLLNKSARSKNRNRSWQLLKRVRKDREKRYLKYLSNTMRVQNQSHKSLITFKKYSKIYVSKVLKSHAKIYSNTI